MPLATPSTTKSILSRFLNAFTPSRQPFVADVSTGTTQAAHTESEDYDVIGESSKDIGTELHDIINIATLKVDKESHGCVQMDPPCSRKRVTKAAIPVHMTKACTPRRSPRCIGTTPSKSVFSPVS